MKRIQATIAGYVALICLGVSAVASAGPITSWGSALVDIQVGDYFDIAASGIETETALGFDDQAGHAALAKANTDYGVNHVYVATSNADVSSTAVAAEALSMWNERILVRGRDGTGRAAITVRLTGEVSSSGANDFEPSFGYGLLYKPEGGITHSQSVIAWSSDSELNDGLGIVTPRDLTGGFTFEYNQPFILYGTLRANVAGNATIDVYHSAEVTSTTFPRDAVILNDGGAPVRAALHFNAVPEPTSIALVFVALMLMTWQAGRRSAPGLTQFRAAERRVDD
jgi:hypothetical protein